MSFIQRVPLGDLYNPGFKINFYTDSSTGVERQVETKATPLIFVREVKQPSPPPSVAENEVQALRNYITSITVETISEGQGVITIEITPPHEEALDIVNNPFLQFNTIIEAEWGYFNDGQGNLVSGKHYYRLNKPSISFGNDTKITLIGNDIPSDNLASMSQQREWNRATNKTDLSIIEKIAADIDHPVEFAPGSVPAPPSISRLEEKKSEPFIQMTSNLDAIRRLCAKNNFSFYFAGERFGRTIINLVDNKLATVSNYNYRLVYRTQPVNDYDIPVYSVQLNPTASFFSNPINRGVTRRYFDHDTGKVLPLPGYGAGKDTVDAVNVSDYGNTGNGRSRTVRQAVSPTATTTAAGTALGWAPLTGENRGAFLMMTNSVPDYDQLAQGLLRDYDRRFLSTVAEVVIPGVPTLLPFVPIRLDGVGRFSGVYLVRSVKHVLSRDGYTCSLSLFLNAPSGDKNDNEGTRTPALPPPTMPAPDGSSVTALRTEGK